MSIRPYAVALGREFWPRKGELALGLLSTFVAAGITLLLPQQTKILFERVFPSGDVGLVARHLAIIFLIVAVGLALSSVRKFLMERLSHRVASAMRTRLYEHIVSVPPRGLQTAENGQIMSIFSNDIQVFIESTKVLLAVSIPAVIFLSIYSVALVWYSWFLFLSLFFLAVPMVVATNYFGRKIHVTAQTAQTRLGDLVTQLEEVLTGSKEIKLFEMEERVTRRFEELNRNSFSSHLKRELFSTLHPFSVSMTVAFGIGGLILASVYMLSREWITLGGLTGFVVCLGLAYPQLQELSHSLGRLVQLSTVMDRIDHVLAMPAERNGADDDTALSVTGRVAFEHVSFAYSTDGFAIDDLTLEIAAGERVAVVGPSGAGKSTLLELLPRFLEVGSGRILIDDIDIASLSLRALRRQIGLVPQQPFLFKASLLDNLMVGAPDATREAVLAMARLARVDAFAERLPDGYDTAIEPRGTNLSVGQRQRIAIARVLLKDPPILLLDEPTSALDSGSERHVTDAIRQVAKNRTTIIVAHRLSTVRDVDRVVVFRDGAIVEQGTHDTLLRRDGAYAELCRQNEALSIV